MAPITVCALLALNFQIPWTGWHKTSELEQTKQILIKRDSNEYFLRASLFSHLRSISRISHDTEGTEHGLLRSFSLIIQQVQCNRVSAPASAIAKRRTSPYTSPFHDT